MFCDFVFDENALDDISSNSDISMIEEKPPNV